MLFKKLINSPTFRQVESENFQTIDVPMQLPENPETSGSIIT